MKTLIWLWLAPVVCLAPVRGEELFRETFDYPDGPLAALTDSPWQNHSGAENEMEVIGGAVRLDRSQTEDVHVAISPTGEEYEPGNGHVLYAGFTATWESLPSAKGAFFCHFMLGSATMRGRLFAIESEAGEESFRLGVTNGSGDPAEAAVVDRELQLGTTYFVVLRYDVDDAATTLWVDPVDESDPAVTATDTMNTVAIKAFALRESSGIGRLDLDNVCLGTNFGEVSAGAAASSTVSLVPGEVTAWETGSTPAVLRLRRSGVTIRPLEVKLEYSGDAVLGSDVEMPPENVVIPAGESSALLQVVPLDDAVAEPLEVLHVAVGSGGDYVVGSDSSSRVLIYDNDISGLLMDEPFGYADGALVEVEGTRWQTHSGTAGEAQITGGVLDLTGYDGRTEDVSALLAGGPYVSDGEVALYAAFSLRCESLPSSNGTYVAHFMGGTASQRGRVFLFRGNAAEGRLQMAISNGGSDVDAATVYPGEFLSGVEYLVVMRYDVATATTTLWVDPAHEDSPHAVATDTTDPREMRSFAFRQTSGMGRLHIAHLRVGKSWQAVAPSIAKGNPVVVTVSPLLEAIGEGESTVDFLVCRRTGPAERSLAVAWSSSGEATLGEDYDIAESVIEFEAGRNTRRIALNIHLDQKDEGVEWLRFHLEPGTGYQVGAPAEAAVAIHDDPPGYSAPNFGRTSEGLFYRVLNAGPDQTMRLEYSEDLREWQPLMECRNLESDLKVIDPGSDLPVRRFYRVQTGR